MPRSIPKLVVALLLSSTSIAHALDSSANGTTAMPARWESAAAAYAALEQFSGQWRGVGDGKWGTSSAEKLFAFILDGKAMCRGGSSVYPVQDRNPEGELHKAHSLTIAGGVLAGLSFGVVLAVRAAVQQRLSRV